MFPYIDADLSDGSGPKVAFAIAGARLVDGHSEERRIVTLKPSKLRGVMSEGMVCSEKELDLSDAHEGNLILPQEAPVGAPLVQYMGDTVLETDVKGPFGHLQSVVGVAREVAALTGQPLREPAPDGLPAVGQAEFAGIEILDPDLCPRYAASLIENVTTGASPMWMQQRLLRSGMRPISNVVDVTNYVMLEMGQPLHAFDYDRLAARAGGRPTIIMRRARPGEHLTTLDGADRVLDPEMLLITDTVGAIAVGGVMGGAETEIHEGTTAVLLEAANFDNLSIRRTSQLLGLPSEAASRFGKGVDPDLPLRALRRAGELLAQVAGGVTRPDAGDCYPGRREPVVVPLDPAYATRLLGVAVPVSEMVRILEALDFRVTQGAGDSLQVTVPSHRRDVTIPADLVEEIGRMVGYDRLPLTLFEDELPPQRRNLVLEGEERIRDLLTGAGLDEVITYSLVDIADEARLLRVPVEELPEHVRVLNPLAADRSHLRMTLLPALLRTARANLRFLPRVPIFELGRVFVPRPGEPRPSEPRRIAGVLVGPREPAGWLPHDGSPLGFFDAKGIVETLLARLGVTGVTWVRASHPALHPGRSARVLAGEVELGVVGELHPAVRAAFDLPDLPAVVFDLDQAALLAAASEGGEMQPLSDHPAVFEDLALVVDDAVPAVAAAQLIRQSGGKLLAGVRLFDVYRGGQVPAGMKSLAFSLVYQAADRTLTDEDVARVRAKIVARLERELGAALRGG
jgi:phenylalanyl-tRNA synthetase beta chain